MTGSAERHSNSKAIKLLMQADRNTFNEVFDHYWLYFHSQLFQAGRSRGETKSRLTDAFFEFFQMMCWEKLDDNPNTLDRLVHDPQNVQHFSPSLVNNRKSKSKIPSKYRMVFSMVHQFRMSGHEISKSLKIEARSLCWYYIKAMRHLEKRGGLLENK